MGVKYDYCSIMHYEGKIFVSIFEWLQNAEFIFRCDYASLKQVVSVRRSVRPSVRPSLGPSVRRSVRMSRVIFERRKTSFPVLR